MLFLIKSYADLLQKYDGAVIRRLRLYVERAGYAISEAPCSILVFLNIDLLNIAKLSPECSF